MNREKVWKIISLAVFFLQLIAQVLTAVIVWQLNILPQMYAIPLLIGFALLSVLSAVLLFVPSKKKTVSNGRRVLACVLALLIVCGCAVVSAVVSDIYQTMQEVTNAEPSGIIRSVYVQANDPAQTLEDAKNYQFSYVENYDTEYTTLAIQSIEKQLGGKIATQMFSSVPEMVDALFEGKTDAIILNDAYVAILEEDENYADFSTRTKRLCDIQIEIEEDQKEDDSKDKPSFHAPMRVTTSPFVMYVSGSDTRSTKLDVSRSDVNILVVVNPVTKQVLLINTPRDYYVPNPAGNGALDKLTHCGIYGVDCSIEALADLYDVDVDYYSQINFTGFETLINAIDGVTIYSDVSFTAQGSVWIQAGENHLYGAEALAFARERYNLSGGDNARGKNQMKVIKAVIEKMTSGATLIKNYGQILESLEGMFVTDMQPSDISKLVKMQLSDMATWNVNTFAVFGTGGSERTYSMPGSYAYVMYPNEKSVDHASELIQRVIKGEILTEADLALQ